MTSLVGALGAGPGGRRCVSIGRNPRGEPTASERAVRGHEQGVLTDGAGALIGEWNVDGQAFLKTGGASDEAGGYARSPRKRALRTGLFGAAACVLLAAVGAIVWRHHPQAPVAPPAPPPPPVTVAVPLRRDVADSVGFLGQFSAVDSVELRAQVGGTLTEIHFRDGQVVKAGDLLFVIDPRPYEIKLDQATAQYQTAEARSVLAGTELWRAQQLKRSDFGSAQSVDQRTADLRSTQAAVAAAKAAIRDAQLDIDYSRVTAPFTGRISDRRVSVGSLVSGSRGGTSPTTLLSTLVSLDPIYLTFDMSEADYEAYRRFRAEPGQAPG